MMTILFMLRFVVLMVSCMLKVIREGQNSHVKVSTIKGELVKAVEANDLTNVQRLIAAGAKVNAKDDQGDTPLHVAARNGYPDTLGALIAARAEVNAGNESGATPLYVAVLYDRQDIVGALIAAGADINAKDDQDNTSLHVAAMNGYQDTLGALIAAGADINAKDDQGDTPLQAAVLYDRQDIVEALLNAGAEVNAKNKQGDMPLHVALENGAYVKAENKQSDTSLQAAARDGYGDIAEALLTAGAEVNAKNKQGATPLYWAAKYDDKAVALLLIHGAKVDVTNTPLHGAARNGDVVLSELFLNQKGTAFYLKNYLEKYLKNYLEKYSLSISNDPEEIAPGIANLPQEIIAQEIIPHLSIYDLRRFLEIPDETGKSGLVYLTAKLKELNEKGDTLSAQDQAKQLLIRTILDTLSPTAKERAMRRLICGTDQGMKPSKKLVALDRLHPVIRLMVTMLTKRTRGSSVVKKNR